ncbi:MAG: helix-turn-helix domain-containing protein [Gemmiger sp.]|uniref:TetR/AcrR family transcriptional regulator n=1 Tax=Gemmiger sp. TaxID=2049027 RepID=UPI002E75FE03|nr:helix-turn-helix domain-containing protein [Gemmiger sp.]MEE0799868.1 helix-turn-helix domain-containing protein [Gemmiger sp.]
MPQTDLRVVKTLRQIDRALLECLAETPFEKITVEQLCRAALINRSTFYKYYQSKYDLMERYLQRTLDAFRRQVNVAFVNASPDRIHHLIYQKNFETVLRFLYKHREEYIMLWSIPLEQGVFGRMVQVVHDAILETLPTPPEGPTLYADLYARLFASDMMTMVRWWLRYEDQVTAAEVQELMNRNMKQGMFRTFRELMK